MHRFRARLLVLVITVPFAYLYPNVSFAIYLPTLVPKYGTKTAPLRPLGYLHTYVYAAWVDIKVPMYLGKYAYLEQLSPG